MNGSVVLDTCRRMSWSLWERAVRARPPRPWGRPGRAPQAPQEGGPDTKPSAAWVLPAAWTPSLSCTRHQGEGFGAGGHLPLSRL